MTNFADQLNIVQEELTAALSVVKDEAMTAFRREILGAERVFVAGKGRSGLQMRGFAMRLMHLGLQVHVVDDVTTPSIHASDLLIIGSGSGRTPSLVGYAERAKKQQSRLVLLTIAEQSPIGDHADRIIRIAANVQVSRVLPMRSGFEMSLGILLDILTAQLMDELGADEKTMFGRHANLE